MVQPTCSSPLECILTKCTVDNLPDGMRGLAEGVDLSWERLRHRSSPKEWDQVLQQLLHLLHVWGCEIDSEAGKKDIFKWVRVKDSGSIQGVLSAHLVLNCYTKNHSSRIG